MALTFATALGEWGRETLLAHPGAFTAGVFTREGPSQDQINGAQRGPRAPAPPRLSACSRAAPHEGRG